MLNGADYNATDELGRTSLYLAANLGLEDCLLTHLKNAIGRDILSLPIKDSGTQSQGNNFTYWPLGDSAVISN